jgi:hypothetical protein
MSLSYQEIKAIVDKLIGEGMKAMGSSQEETPNSPTSNQNKGKGGNPSGYGDQYGVCGAKETYDTHFYVPNDKVDQYQAKRLLDRVTQQVVADITGTSRSICAAYVKRIAKKYFEYYNKPTIKLSTIPSWKQTEVSVGGSHAKNKDTHDWLVRSFGYTRITLGKNLTPQEAINVINSIKYNIGDIVSYWDHSGSSEGKQIYGHIQIYTGTNPSGKWVSDFRHDSFVYNSKGGGCWDVIYLQAPNKKEPKIES